MSRVLFYVQHLLGVGHLRRAGILAEAMEEAGLEVVVALGGRPLQEVSFRGVTTVQLPPAAIAGDDFSTLLDEAGRPVDDAWRQARTAQLLDLHRRLDPDVLLTELYPFGRRQFRFELLPLLEAVRRGPSRAKVACSVRDILVAKPGREAEIVATVRNSYDAVLVHGDPKLIPFAATFAAADAIRDLISYTGYVAAAVGDGPPADAAGEVIVSAGGGAVGGPLIRAALAARGASPLRANVWRILTGPNLPSDVRDELDGWADDRTIVETFRADFAARLTTAALSISQAGYNTTMDILRSGVRAVVVPYETGGETEQRLRSDLLAARGLLTVVPADMLAADTLARAIHAAAGRAPRALSGVKLDGAQTTARLVTELAAARRGVVKS